MRQQGKPRVSQRSGDSESMNMKSLCFPFHSFVHFPSLILVCGIVERESLKDIVPVKYRFCGSVGVGRSNNTSSQRPCTSRVFSRIYRLGISKGYMRVAGQIDRVPRLGLQLFQKLSRLVLFHLFMLNCVGIQNRTSTFVRTMNVLRSCCMAAANILEERQLSFSSKSEVMKL